MPSRWPRAAAAWPVRPEGRRRGPDDRRGAASIRPLEQRIAEGEVRGDHHRAVRAGSGGGRAARSIPRLARADAQMIVMCSKAMPLPSPRLSCGGMACARPPTWTAASRRGRQPACPRARPSRPADACRRLSPSPSPMRSPMTAARTRWAASTAAALSAVTFLHTVPGRAGSPASTARLRRSRRLPLTVLRFAGHPMTGRDVTGERERTERGSRATVRGWD